MLFTSVTTLCVGAIQSIQTTILQIRGTSPSTGTSVNWIAIIAALFFIMIFVITGYLLIRNIFEISVVQEIKKYGLLRTIGTTEKQIKRIVYKQAFWLSIIGISIGLILGYIVGILMLPWILNFMKGEYHNLSVNLSFNPIIFVVAGIFSAITVWVDYSVRADSGDVAFTYQLHNKRVPLHGACEMRIGLRRDRLEDKSKYYVAGVTARGGKRTKKIYVFCVIPCLKRNKWQANFSLDISSF